MKLFTTEMIIISVLVVSSVLTPSTSLQASSKGLKLYLTVYTNLDDDVRINTYQHGDRVFTHDAVIHSGSNEVTLQYPSGLINTGEFRTCVRSNNYDESACDTGYNSEAKQPEHVFINLFVEENRNSPNDDADDSQAQSQSQSNDNTNTNANSQSQTTIICREQGLCNTKMIKDPLKHRIASLVVATISLLMVATISDVYAGGPRLDYPSDSTSEGADCWVDGYDAGFAGKYDKARADRCAQENDEYNRSWGYACKDGGFTEDECNEFKENPVDIEDYEALKGENDRTCNDAGYEDGEAGAFNKDRDKGCYEFGSYKKQFQSGCETHTTQVSCELLYEDKEYYCPNHPDIAGCVDFLHNATNKKAVSPYDSCAGMGDPRPQFTCPQEVNPERYCLEYDDPYCRRSL